MKKQNHFLHWLLILGFMLTSVLTVQYTTNLQVSVLDTPEHAPFDGTVYPVQNVPDWTALSNQDITYSECDNLISIPEYDTDLLLKSTSNLTWGTSEYEEAANAQITYSVVYAGTYEYDHIEGAGSHPAVDIKTLQGTPVYAIANGVILEASYSSSGFGNNIVIGHYDVPSLENENILTDLYSSYSHLNEILVAEGDVVEKGEMIGRVGDTGTATTEHLHFQIDNDDAPWHPYWPFTYSDYSSAGLTFWGAVSAGLGQDNVYDYTINPMDYVQEYLDYEGVVKNEEDNDETDFEEAVVEEDIVASTEDEEDDNDVYTYVSSSTNDDEEEPANTIVQTKDSRDFSEIQVQNDSYVLLNNNLSVYLTLKDEDDKVFRYPEFTGSIQMSLSDTSVANLSISHIESDDFNDGYYQFVIAPMAVGSTTLSIEFEDYSYETEITVIETVEMVDGFELEHDGYFVIDVPEEITVKAIDINGDFTPVYNVNGSVLMSLVSGEGDFYPDVLKRSDFEYGVATVIFTPSSSEDVVIKAKNGALVGSSSVLKGTLFEDLDDDYSYYKAIKFLREEGVVNGYPDGTFKADSSVSRVEALKMIFEALGTELVENSDLSFSDVDNNAWYTDYVATAEELGIVNGYPDGTFRPSDPVNKVELVKMLLNAADISVDPVVVGDPYDDVDNLEWFAPYVNYVKDANLTPVDGDDFEPDKDMSRGEVAETIYRMLAIEQNGVSEYSVTLSMN